MAGGADDTEQAVTAHLYRFSLTTFDWEDVTHSTNNYTPAILPGVQVYNDYLYVFFGWNTTQQQDLGTMFRTSLDASSDFSWEPVELERSDLARDSFGFSLVGTSVYIFSGFTISELKNSLYAFDFSVMPIGVTNYPNHDAPALRFGHTLNSVYHSLYVFGGATQTEYLNDLWQFQPDKESWQVITGSGQVPSPRSSHGSSTDGDTLMIWGGIGPGGLLNDLHKYSVTLKTWERIEPLSELVPSPRSDPCVALSTPYVFIFGGYTEIGLTNELWLFNTGDKTYTLLSSGTSKGPASSHKQTCSVEVQGDGNLHLYVMMGTGASDEALGQFYYYNFNEGTWDSVYELPIDYRRNFAYVEKIDRKVIIAGGESWGVYLFYDILSVDLDSKSVSVLGRLDDHFVAGGGTYFRNHFYLHGGSNPIGIIHRPRAPSNNFLKYDLFNLCASCNFSCSLGSKHVGDTCELCERGYYLSDYFGTECKPCDPGFANGQLGASSLLQCFPCAQGSYAENPGSEYCIDCPATAFCSIGSDSILYGAEQFDFVAEQPDFYAPRTSEVSSLSSTISGSVAIILILLSILCCAVPRLHPVFKNIDIYGRIELNDNKDKVIRHKNLLGGCCQMICIGISTLFLSQTIIAYWIDNVHETKALVPYVVLEESEVVWSGEASKFAADLQLEVSLENYFAGCISEEDKCATTINVEDSSGFPYSLHCYETGHVCTMSLSYDTITLKSTTRWTFQLSSPQSYSSGIRAVLTTSSSVLHKEGHEQLSSKSQHLYSSEGTVFKGSPPTTLYFTAIPSMFTDRIKGDQLTGYHVLVDKSPFAGSEALTSDLQFEDDLLIVIEVGRSENGFMTIREEKEAWFLLLFALIGSLIGIFEIIEIAKYAADRLQQKVEKEQGKLQELREIGYNEGKYRDILQINRRALR